MTDTHLLNEAFSAQLNAFALAGNHVSLCITPKGHFDADPEFAEVPERGPEVTMAKDAEFSGYAEDFTAAGQAWRDRMAMEASGSPSPFKFGLHERVRLCMSPPREPEVEEIRRNNDGSGFAVLRSFNPREAGEVIGRAEYVNRFPQYLVRYKAADGRQVEEWFSDDAIVLDH